MADKVYDYACIYKVVGGGLTYFGSTKNFQRRVWGHEQSYKDFMAGKSKYRCSSADVLATGTYKFEIIEEFNKISKFDLQRKERDYIMNNTCVNSYRPGQSDKDKANYITDYHKQYYVSKKEEIKAKRNVQVYCDSCNLTYSKSNKSRHEKSPGHVYSLNLINSKNDIMTTS